MFDPMELLHDKNALLILSKPLARALGISGSIILRRIFFWADFNRLAGKTATHFHRGKWWMYNTYAEWSADLQIMSEDTCARTLTELEKLGIIIGTSEYNPHPMMKNKWYTIDYETYSRFMHEWNIAGRPMANGYKSKEYKDFLQKWDVLRTQPPSPQIAVMEAANYQNGTSQIAESNNSIESEEKHTDILVAADAGDTYAPPAENPLRVSEDTTSEALLTSEQQNVQGKLPRPVSNRMNITEHQMVRYFMIKTNTRVLTAQMEKLFTSPITVNDHESERKITYNDLLWHWDNELGFEEFVRMRSEELLECSRPIEPINLLKHLTNFGAGPTEERPRVKRGWIQWREAHPSLCTEYSREVAETKGVLPLSAIEEMRRFEEEERTQQRDSNL